MLKKLSLLFVVFGMALSLQCYDYNSYTNKKGVAHHQSHCVAFYEVEDGAATFGGRKVNPVKKGNSSSDDNKEKDCLLETMSSFDGASSDVWVCRCYTTMCNFPFGWKEFEARGHTLAPAWPVNENIF